MFMMSSKAESNLVDNPPILCDDYALSGKVQVAGYADIPRMVETEIAAFEHDPLISYLRDTPDARCFQTKLQAHLTYSVHLWAEVRDRYVLTIDNGDAIVMWAPPGAKKGVLRRMMQLFDHAMSSIFDSKEQRKRAEEMNGKYELALREAFGTDILRMSYVRVLATSPRKQGRGYGSALMAAVNTKADSLGCASWLLSSNVANTAFYESCGFVGVKEIMIGDDNPTWTQPPFPILIMVRPAHNQLSFEAGKEKLSMASLV